MDKAGGKNFMTRFLSLGTISAEERGIRLTYKYSLFTVMGMLGYALIILAIDPGLYYLSLLQLFSIVPPVIAIILVGRKKYKWAKLLICYFPSLTIITTSVFFLGRNSYVHIYLFIFTIIPITVYTYRKHWNIIIPFLLNIALFLLIDSVDTSRLQLTSLPQEYNRFHALASTIVCIISIGVIVLIYQIDTEKYQEALQQTTIDLNEVNKNLLAQQNLVSETNKLLSGKQIEIEKKSELLRKKNKILNETLATKDKFFSIISHDLRNPLVTLMGFAELLNKPDYDPGPEKEKQILDALLTSSRKTYTLMENLLLWSQSQTSGIIPKPEKINLLEAMLESVDLHQNMCTRKQIKLDIDIENSIEVHCDRLMLNSILNNLLSNALKFTPEKGQVSIFVASSSEKYVEVCQKDTGIGIPKDQLKKLFRIENSYSTPGTNNEQGTGLGLMLCKEFIEKNGGKIRVQSAENKGTAFYFTLPRI